MSSVAVPFEQIGFEAARWVDGMLQGTAPSGSLLELPPSHVVQRQSTDVVAVEDPEIAAAVKYIRDRLDEQIYVPDVVEQTGLGRRMFEIRFRQAVGCTPGTYITRLRMNLAERLLAETDQSIPDVAAGCGYTNATHLGVAFKKHAGESPTAYRRRFRLSQ
jgi:LacI family transcriptional regulator